MGACAERYADRLIITNDNPRTEEPDRIIRDILAGMQRPQAAEVLREREQAIQYALSEAKAGDIVVILGKGHEDYQLLGMQSIPYSDRRVVRQWFEG
jgi:UDP-N-acetylmuramoyl-L-alanyl-D-glutamate--2,6-diaminopimelate ligase